MNRISARIPWFRIAVLLVLSTLAVGVDIGVRGLHRFPEVLEQPVQDGDARRGERVFLDQGCGACHAIRWQPQAVGRVGPRLDGLREQMYLAGMLYNEPENLILWIQHPDRVNPATVMPNLEIGDEDARDIAAYLYTLP